MKVILKKDVPRLGPKNTVLDVSDAYAMNVLIKQGLATQVTKGLENKLARDKEEKQYAQQVKGSKHLQLIETLIQKAKLNDGILFTIKRKSDDKGHLYGAITEAEIVDKVFDVSGLSISQKQVYIKAQIKSLGEQTFVLKAVGNEKDVTFKFEVK